MSVGYAMEARVDKKHSSKEKLKKDRVAKAESMVKKFDVRKEYSIEPRLSTNSGNEGIIKYDFDKAFTFNW